MADGSFFDELARAWREGWKRGAPVNPGPRVGRGVYSNWCLSERQREITELRVLSSEVYRQFKASPFASQDGFNRTLIDLFHDIFERAELEASDALIDALISPVYDLVREEFFTLPRRDMHRISRLSMERRVELRRELLRKQRFLSDYGRPFDLGMNALAQLIGAYLAAVPDWPASGDSHDLSFETRLIDLMENPVLLIEATLGVFTDDRIEGNELFKRLRGSLEWNWLTASGIEPINRNSSKALVLPSAYKSRDLDELIDAYLARTPFEDIFRAPLPLAVPDSVRFEHTLIVGGSGHGKSQLLLKLIHHDLTNDGDTPPGVIVIDSQGDLIYTLSRLALFDPDAANSLADRLIIVDPVDVEYPIALNLFAFDHERLEGYSRADRERVLNSVIDLYEYFFSALLGAELTQKQGVVFRYLARLMAIIPDATIQTLRQLMEDGKPFRPYMDQLEGSAKHFFETEFFSPGFTATKKQILRRLWGVLANPVFERMFSHPENRLDLFKAMNEGKIVLINTAKDLLKAEGCSIFGRFFIAKIAQAALERATIPEEKRRPTFVYVDEAHEYFDETFEHLFNQARKYRVGLHIACQNLDQMPARLRATVMASTALKFAGGVSAKDARALAEDMNTTAEFIGSMRKRRGRSEIAASIRNRTARALRVNVELGQVNALPALDEAAYQGFIDRNRDQYSATIDEVEQFAASTTGSRNQGATAPDSAPDHPLKVLQQAGRREAGRASRIQPLKPSSAVSPADPAQRHEEIDAYVAGVGGRRHKQLQEFVRQLAQERGYKATVEKRILGGSVDVALEHQSRTIAVEISISTDAGQERANVKKCIQAGFDEVLLVVPEEARRVRMAKEVRDALSHEDKSRLLIIGPRELADALNQRMEAPLSTSAVRGWRVTTHYSDRSTEDAKIAQEAILRAIIGSEARRNF